MAYGESMKRLSPCSDEHIVTLLKQHCGGFRTLLDLGCGRGDRLKAIAESFPNARLLGVDADAENTAKAAESCQSAQILCADAGNLPYENESFDAALCECSFSLFADASAAAGELGRVMKHGGILVISDLTARVSAKLESGIVQSIYTRLEIEDFFHSAGFRMLYYEDRSSDLTAMVAQMIFDGTLCQCLSSDAVMQLRKMRAGYGLWIMERE